MTQFVRYLDAWSEDTASKDRKKESYTTTRKYSNMLYTLDPGMDLETFSAKLPVLLKNIAMYPRQKHYVYSSFGDRHGSGQGIYAIAKALETELGYVKLTAQEAQTQDWFALGVKRRYILMTNAELAGSSTSKRLENASALLRVFNDVRNKYGDYVHVLLASQNFFQAMDLAAVRHIHIVEPFLSRGSDLQALGRGRRYCSHKDLLFDRDWTVTIHRYMSDMPLELRLTPEDGFKKRLESLRAEANDTRQKIDALRQTLAPAPNALVANRAKDSIAMYEEHARYLQQQIVDAAWKDEARRLKMIDEIVTINVRKQSEQLLGVLRALQEASLDCRVFAQMHGITCASPSPSEVESSGGTQ